LGTLNSDGKSVESSNVVTMVSEMILVGSRMVVIVDPATVTVWFLMGKALLQDSAACKSPEELVNSGSNNVGCNVLNCGKHVSPKPTAIST
jgi:hypothetical protein